MTLATIIRTALGFGPMQLDFLQGGGIGPGRRGLAFNNVYGLGVEDGRRVRGGPDWIRSERYTIEAVADGAATAEQMRGPMLRALLERRFQLKAHVETEQVPAFNLTIARSGLKIKPVDSDTVDKSGFVNATVSNGGACEPQPTIGRGQPAIVRPAQPGERQPPPPSTPGQPVTVLFRNFVDVRAYRARFQVMNDRMRELIRQGVKKDDLKTLDQARARLKLAELGWDNSVSTTTWFSGIAGYYDELAASLGR